MSHQDNRTPPINQQDRDNEENSEQDSELQISVQQTSNSQTMPQFYSASQIITSPFGTFRITPPQPLNDRVFPIDARQAYYNIIGRAARDFESNRIDMGAFRAARPLSHLLRLPREVRLMIYDTLFKGARMTYDPDLGPEEETETFRRSEVFMRENMSTEILFVCKDIHEEALKVLFTKLAVENRGRDSDEADFGAIVSQGTRLGAQEIWNVNLQMAVNMFQSLRLWVRTETCIINNTVWSEFTNLNSEEMFTKAVESLDKTLIPDKDFLSLFRVANRSHHTAFMCKIDLLCCYQMGEADGNDLFRPTRDNRVCFDIHESSGHVYLDFFKEMAFFDRADALGHDACIMILRRM